MTTERDDGEGGPDVAPASLLDALLVYAEPLATGAHAVVVGDAGSSVADRLLELGARGVLVFDPDGARAAKAARTAPRGVTVRALNVDLDVRDGAFDLAVVPDLALLDDPRRAVARLRRAVASSGAVVAMGRARSAGLPANVDIEGPFGAELGPAVVEYAELYELFAGEFEDVSLVGVLPFQGVVFAELGTEDEAPAVSVDTRLSAGDPPSVFVVVASNAQRDDEERAALDPYAIVQVPERIELQREDSFAVEAVVAAAQLRVEVLSAQLEEAREGLVVADVRSVEIAARLDRAVAERDAALTRAMELETILGASQQTLATLERRLLEAEQGMLERDDRLAALSAELDARHSATQAHVPPDEVRELSLRAENAEAALALALADIAARDEEAAQPLDSAHPELVEAVARAERAETALALHVADLAHVAEAHAAETAGYEEQLRERARVIAALEREVGRREQLVKELVASLEESREGTTNGVVFESAVPLSAPAPRRDPALEREAARLRQKLDELAGEIARREGELTARAWRITELENERARPIEAAKSVLEGPNGDSTGTGREVEVELARMRDELDALRQALAQEHAARIAAESGEELSRARSALAQQEALLEQLRARTDRA